MFYNNDEKRFSFSNVTVVLKIKSKKSWEADVIASGKNFGGHVLGQSSKRHKDRTRNLLKHLCSFSRYNVTLHIAGLCNYQNGLT